MYDNRRMGIEMIFIFLLALILFGPKKLPEIAREIGKFMAEFKRASNDFKYQLQSEIEKAGADDDPAASRHSRERSRLLRLPRHAASRGKVGHLRDRQRARTADADCPDGLRRAELHTCARPSQPPVAPATAETEAPAPATLIGGSDGDHQLGVKPHSQAVTPAPG